MREGLHAVARNDVARGIARGSAGEQREDARAAALLLSGVPYGAERQRRAEGAGSSRDAPEPLRKLQQRLGRPPVFQARDRFVLRSGQRRRDRHAPQLRSGQREH
jgi:hypothetical protein